MPELKKIGEIAKDILPFGEIIGNIFGADEQSEAIEKAAKSTENWQKYLVNLEKRKYDEAERFRNLAFNEAKMKVGAMRTAMPLLKQYATSEPGTSPQYQTALRRGTQSMMQNLAPYGLTKSSVTGEGMGELTGSLLSADWQNILNTQKALAGYQTGISPETGYPNMGAATQAQGQYSDLLTSGGAVQGGLYGSLGQDLTRMPYYYNLLKQMGGSGGTGVGLPGGGAGTGGSFYNQGWSDRTQGWR